jgi:hypothetical protein
VEEDPTGGKLASSTGRLNGAPHKLGAINHFHVGDTITAMQRASLQPGGQEVGFIACDWHQAAYELMALPALYQRQMQQGTESGEEPSFLGGTSLLLFDLPILMHCKQVIVYATSMGAIGAFYPFTSREDADFFTHLEMHMRQVREGGRMQGQRHNVDEFSMLCFGVVLCFTLLASLPASPTQPHLQMNWYTAAE